MVDTQYETKKVDTKEDLDRVIKIMKRDKLYEENH